jgi:ATP-binding protein involved in chromosome partitioning
VTKLFKNLFSSSQLSSQGQDLIRQTLDEYRSTCFPQGILVVADNFSMKAKKQKIIITLILPFPCQSEFSELTQALSELLKCEVIFELSFNVMGVRQHQINGIKNIIAVASGKGGVGKSTTAVNLAYALQTEGATVGILDADVYGPSIPTMLGVVDAKPTSSDGKVMDPIVVEGLQAMSIGFLVPDEDAAIWRGPMASKAFNQLLNETAWGQDKALDYLIIDMPPGTGDIQITLSQQIPVAAAVIVTTPQNVALADAIKGLAMFEKVKVPVLGVVENMSYHICDNCGHHEHIFGEGGGEFVSEQYKTPFLGSLPLDSRIREDADCGVNILIENSASDLAVQYRKIVRNVAAQLFLQLDVRSPNTADVIVDQ